MFFFGLALAPPLIFLCLVLGSVAGGLIVTGGPGPCVAGGSEPIVFSDANADSYQRKWDAFDAALDAGRNATVTFNESELSSRARRALNGREEEYDDETVEDPRICLHDGYGETSARLGFPGPGFLDIKFRARVSVEPEVRGDEVRGDEVRGDIVMHLERLEIGNLPGFVADWLGAIPEEIWAQVTGDALDHSYRVTLREGELEIIGFP